MHLPVSNRSVVRILVGLAFFGALSSLAGAVLAIAANGGGVPVEYLTNSPFAARPIIRGAGKST